IRRLVRLAPGLYRFPVADTSEQAWRPGFERRNNTPQRYCDASGIGIRYDGLRKDPLGDTGFLSFRAANLV
ncbi:hypothetical protein OC610_29075, partial [Pseudomonas sp. SAICEU22]